MTDSVECVVIGAGVVGLAVARQLATAGLETILLEKENLIGAETSSRNSEVIHAGIYYPPGSLKAELCVSGKAELYAWCESHGIRHRRCGKLIVATTQAQVQQLETIRANAAENGVVDLELIDGQHAMKLEPALSCEAALLSPSTGIIDSHGYMLSLQGEFEAAGGMIAFGTGVEALRAQDTGFDLTTADGTTLRTRYLINSGGLHAQSIAAGIKGFTVDRVPATHYAKGNYYTLGQRSPFDRLIYPVTEDGGLGVHLTIDLGGGARFGPDVEWTRSINYDVDPARSAGFYAAIRRYWPALPDNALSPGYAGIRPKITGPGEPAGDFIIQGPADHGLPGLVNLFGIESPGLTASLAIARRVRDKLL